MALSLTCFLLAMPLNKGSGEPCSQNTSELGMGVPISARGSLLISLLHWYYYVSNVKSWLSCDFIHLSTTDTTDVQSINAIHDENRDVIILQCDFILGTVAQGCMVVLVGESKNITVNLTRFFNTACSMETFELPTTDIIYVFGYDIENDGSIGTFAIPGKLNGSQSMVCMQPSVVPSG